jgi:hypothetical protein
LARQLLAEEAQGRNMSMSEMSAASRNGHGHQRALKILAKSVYRELKSSGYSRSDVVGFTNELLDLVTTELRDGDTREPRIS